MAIGELADGLDIDLNAVPQEVRRSGRHGACHLRVPGAHGCRRRAQRTRTPSSLAAAKENLEAVVVAIVTDKPRLCMTWNGNTIVDVSRDFLNTNGASKHVDAERRRTRRARPSPARRQAIPNRRSC